MKIRKEGERERKKRVCVRERKSNTLLLVVFECRRRKGPLTVLG